MSDDKEKGALLCKVILIIESDLGKESIIFIYSQ